MRKPVIGITMGDPSGIGPEVTIKALIHPEVQQVCAPIIFGTIDILEKAGSGLDSDLRFQAITSPDEIDTVEAPAIPVLESYDLLASEVLPGEISKVCGQAAAAYIEAAIQAALNASIDAITTGPIHKKALVEAGYPFLGHTEMLADRCGVDHTAMMLASPGRYTPARWLRVTHATAHIAFRAIPSSLHAGRLLRTIELTDQGMQSLGIPEPELALAALNPHASDNGLMGDEEERLLGPVVEEACSQGYRVKGPIPADTVFLRAIQGEFDAVVALYHDQGHIPIKTYGFERAVNITLGLPITRTSVDHGTAMDIVGQNIADPSSMIEAIKLAAHISHTNLRNH